MNPTREPQLTLPLFYALSLIATALLMTPSQTVAQQLSFPLNGNVAGNVVKGDNLGTLNLALLENSVKVTVQLDVSALQATGAGTINTVAAYFVMIPGNYSVIGISTIGTAKPLTESVAGGESVGIDCEPSIPGPGCGTNFSFIINQAAQFTSLQQFLSQIVPKTVAFQFIVSVLFNCNSSAQCNKNNGV